MFQVYPNTPSTLQGHVSTPTLGSSSHQTRTKIRYRFDQVGWQRESYSCQITDSQELPQQAKQCLQLGSIIWCLLHWCVGVVLRCVARSDFRRRFTGLGSHVLCMDARVRNALAVRIANSVLMPDLRLGLLYVLFQWVVVGLSKCVRDMTIGPRSDLSI